MNTAAGKRTATAAAQWPTLARALPVRRMREKAHHARADAAKAIALQQAGATERVLMVLNRQRQVRIPLQTLEKFLARTRKALRLPADSFTVCLVTNATIAKWNGRYRGKNRATDVLSFPTGESHRANGNFELSRRRATESGAAADYLGDIAIAPRVAMQNAHRLGRSFEEELCILALHGALHLMGYDHETDTGQMERREMKLRRALKLA